MNFGHPLPTFLRLYTNVSKLSGHEKVLIVTALLTGGKVDEAVSSGAIKKAWSRSSLKTVYHYSALYRAQEHGWLKPATKGVHSITQSGLDHLTSILKEGTVAPVPIGQSELKLFEAGQTHSFDKHLRELLSGAGAFVRIADSYVDETVFDNLLDQIQKSVRIQLMYGKSFNAYEARAKRFSTEFPKFAQKNNRSVHDRLLIIDSAGYILGPSLKDAAQKSPASIVRLNAKDSEKLIKFFDKIWKSTP